ncbi:patatin-like phospholipase family protein [Aminobacter carboxidus]|uniref:Patatin-like phospholipase family protein n=1 Tax=Aminobacter carboxidus TaxID=376165 RepID=A0ABR9GQS7_9HYPH|nr:patatin-like phospholipase family protein [Aminobacter carboxidus]
MTVEDKPFRILTLDGGGAKGFYTLGVLHELEAMLGKPLHQAFDLIFGTSTGAIIGTLLAVGTPVTEIHKLYRRHVPDVMRPKEKERRSAALKKLGDEIFKDQKFDAVKTGLGVVATKWVMETPIIFKSDPKQAHGRGATFVQGFGCTLSDAVQASCSAYPFFSRRQLKIDGDELLLLDGGFCANNPTLYAIADAVRAYKLPHDRIKVLNVGVGDYPVPRLKRFTKAWFISWADEAELIQKTFNINAQSMEQLRCILFPDIETIRISEAFTEPSMETDLLEYNLAKLDLIHTRGRDSFGKMEAAIRKLLG